MSKIIKIGNKYYDFGSKNASFLLTASELKALGIKNYYFMLEVKFPQTGVQDIDPYKKDITPEEIAKIIMECKANPWFFFREVSHVVARGVGELPLYLHRAGCAAIWCFMHSIDFHLVQPRQTYKTTVITAIMSYMMLFEYRDCDIPYMHKTEKRCTDNVGLLRDYICALPKYLNPWAKNKHLPGLQSLKYEAHNVSIATVSAAKSETVAGDKMRGYSLFTWFIDEAEFIPYMKQVIDGANPTIVQARANAKLAGIRSCMIYASTPGDLETQEGKDFQHIIDNTPRFNESMYDLTDEELQKMFEPDLSGSVTTEELTNPDGTKKEETPEPKLPLTMVYIEFDYKQLRKDEAYLTAQYLEAVSKNTIGEYRRGVLLQRFRGADGALFDQADIDYIQQHVRRPDHSVFIMKKYTLFVYNHEIKHPDPHSSTPYFDITLPYLIGIDIAGARGAGDNTAIVIVNPYTLEVVGELKSPYIGLLDLMKIVIALADMLPRAVFCPETNNNGTSLIDLVQETPLAARFYKDPKKNLMDNVLIENSTPQQMEIRRKANEKRQIGTFVTPQVRNAMFDLLKRYIKDYRHLFYTEFLVSDICNLVRNKNGKIEAATGEHDDIVMAYNHCIYILNFGYDLTRYGIDKHLCTFEKVHDVLREHEEQEAQNTIDNMLPYDTPTMYEEQLLEELTSNSVTSYTRSNYVDEMGYRPEQYDRSGGLQPSDPDDAFGRGELEFYSSLNVF